MYVRMHVYIYIQYILHIETYMRAMYVHAYKQRVFAKFNFFADLFCYIGKLSYTNDLFNILQCTYAYVYFL